MAVVDVLVVVVTGVLVVVVTGVLVVVVTGFLVVVVVVGRGFLAPQRAPRKLSGWASGTWADVMPGPDHQQAHDAGSARATKKSRVQPVA